MTTRKYHHAVLAVGLASLVLACGSHSRPPAPTVEYSGCWMVSIPGPVCALYPPVPEQSGSLLTLWVRTDAGTRVEIRAGDELLEAAGEEVQGGRRFALAVPLTASSLTVRLHLPGGARSASWSLALTPPAVPAWTAGINRLSLHGKRKEAQNRLAQLQRAVPRGERGLVLWMLAFLAKQEGRDEETKAYLKQGITADRAAGLLSGEGEKTAWLARLHMDQGRFDEARSDLSALRLPAGAPADVRYLVLFDQGFLASRVGDYRSALEQLRDAADLAERSGMKDYRWKAEQALANVLQSLGRSQDTAELFARLRSDPHPETPCDIGTLLTNEAWSRLLAREGGERAAEDPTPALQQARDIYDRERCRPAQRFNARLNLALAHQQAGRRREARQALEEIRRLAPQADADLTQHLWWLDLEGRQAIAEGRPESALASYAELSRLAEQALSLEGRFRAAAGRANARLALGERVAAMGDLAAADRLLDEQTWLIPADQGRDTFVAQRERATRLYLQILLEQGDRQLAFALARHARSRLLRQLAVRDRLAQLGLDEQTRWDKALSKYWALRSAIDLRAAAEWQIPADQAQRAREERFAQLAAARRELDIVMASFGARNPRENSLPPPGPGEVILAYHPLPEGWAGFAVHADRIEVSRFKLLPGAVARIRPSMSQEELAGVLLAPFRAVLAGAKRVRVLPYGPLRSVDFHALPFAGEPLLAHAAVVYSLDLPTGATARPARPNVLLVADSEGDLPAARQEADAVGTSIRAWGQSWALKRLEGADAGAESVLPALASADLFHFAGHGDFAGFAGWDSALRLSGGSRLTLSDLLALPRVPSWVVLSACDSGHSSEQAPGEGVGLAQAFLLAGTRDVIAATRPVLDSTARDLLSDLYSGWQPGADLALRLQQAQLACRRRSPHADWASFRLLER